MKKRRIALRLLAGIGLTLGLQSSCQEQSRSGSKETADFLVRQAAHIEALAEEFDAALPILKGHILVINSNLSSLEGLPPIEEVEGRVRIAHNDSLQALQGLQDLRSISGSLIIEANQRLASLEGLGKLEYIGGSLFILGNGGLRSVAGLDSLENLDGKLVIEAGYALLNHDSMGQLVGQLSRPSHEPRLELRLDVEEFIVKTQASIDSLAALGGDALNITGITGDLLIHKTALQSLKGLEFLADIGGNVHVRNNPDLVDLQGLENIEQVEGTLLVEGNSSLSSLKGLEQLREIGGLLVVKKNAAMSSLEGLEHLKRVHGAIYVEGNQSLGDLKGLEGLRFLMGNRLVVRGQRRGGEHRGHPAGPPAGQWLRRSI